MSDARNDLKVGDSVYVYDARGYMHKCIVIKRGRKWLTATNGCGDTFQFDRTDSFTGQYECGRAPRLMTEEQYALSERLQALVDNANLHCTKLSSIHRAVNRCDLAQARMDLQQAMAEYAAEIDQVQK